MRSYAVGRVEEFVDSQPRRVTVNGISIGVYRFRERYFAYENVCPHQGGPACEGKVIAETECEVSQAGSLVGKRPSADDFSLSCPWHGVEYDIKTGIGRANSKMRLRRFKVKVTDGSVTLYL